VNTYPNSIIPDTYVSGDSYFIDFKEWRNNLSTAIKSRDKKTWIEISYRDIRTSVKETLEDFYNGQFGQFKKFLFTDWISGTEYEARFDSEVTWRYISSGRWSSGTIRILLLKIAEAAFSNLMCASNNITRHNLATLAAEAEENFGTAESSRATNISHLSGVLFCSSDAMAIGSRKLIEVTAETCVPTGRESVDFGGTIYGSATDGTYVWTARTGTLHRISLSDFSGPTTSVVLTSKTIMEVLYHEGFIYTVEQSGSGLAHLRKVDPATMTQVASAETRTLYLYGLAAYGNLIFVGGRLNTSGVGFAGIQSYSTTDLSLVSTVVDGVLTTSTSNYCYGLFADADNVFGAWRHATSTLHRCSKYSHDLVLQDDTLLAVDPVRYVTCCAATSDTVYFGTGLSGAGDNVVRAVSRADMGVLTATAIAQSGNIEDLLLI